MTTRIAAGRIRLKRAYEPPTPDDGPRILIDRLWPRGVAKAEAAIDRWSKDLAPSTPLRQWFGHDPARWDEFRRRYAEELHQHPEQLEELRALARKAPITLVYGARDEAHNNKSSCATCFWGRTGKQRHAPQRPSMPNDVSLVHLIIAGAALRAAGWNRV